MATVKNKYSVLVASSGDKIHEQITEILPKSDYDTVISVHDAGEARRIMLTAPADIVVINTPLPDDFGIDLALDLTEYACGVLLLVKNEIFDQVCYKVEDSGILTLSKPLSKGAVYHAVKLLTALSARLKKMEKKNKTLQEKMADIRAVNRAKWLLIENLNMNEKDAHYYIEKRAMDARLSRREVAESIIRTYDK